MRRKVILAIVLFGCLLWLDSPSRKRRDPNVEPPAAVEDASLKADTDCGQDAIRFQERTQVSSRQAEPRPVRMESLLSILLSSARTAATWGAPAALVCQVQALLLRI
jgi:hypothetical protein